MYYLGVDGGGTKTAFLLMDGEGHLVSRTTLGTLDWFQIGAEGVRDTLEQGIGQLCGEAGIARSQLAYAVLGIPSLGDELIDERPRVEAIVRHLLPGVSFHAVNDAEVGWAGSLACRAGIHLVSGTGAIGYGVDSAGRTCRASGWGHELGDEGSAYWLGKKLLAAFTREADGREPRSRFYDLVRQRFGLDDDYRLLKIVGQEWGWSREKIAGLATLLHQAADEGEKKAVQAFDQAAYELSLIVHSVAAGLRFEEEEEIPVSYSGGVFRAGAYVTQPLRTYLGTDRFVLSEPFLEPVAGAVLYAFKQAHPQADLRALALTLKKQTE